MMIPEMHMMKSWKFFSVFVVLLLFLGTAAKPIVFVEAEERRRVLIINSYAEQVNWSNSVTDSLLVGIQKEHPEWIVYSGNLKTESATYAAAAALTLRSMLWNYAERTNTSIDATNLDGSTLFVQDDVPDVIIWIGEEGFLHYITYTLMLGKWREVPMVLCAVRDSVASDGWYPERGFHFDSLKSIRDYSVVKIKISASNLHLIEIDKGLRITPSEEKGSFDVETTLNYSGCIVQLPIRQNLELIHHLMPDLEELIWVDDNSYRSEESRLKVERMIRETMPGVKYSKMIHNRMNMDSIYDVMLEPAQHRAFLTYSWNIDGRHSTRSDKEIDSLFTHASTAPLFTLTERDFNKDNYWVGGSFLSRSEVVKYTLAKLECAVKCDSLSKLPFDTLSEARIILNRTALERYGLAGAAHELSGVSYVHIPPAFYQKYERQLLFVLLGVVIVMCYIIISLRRSRYNRQIGADYARYKRLYDKLQVIYDNSSIDFALYDESGKCQLRIINGKVEEATEENSSLFHENIFESIYLTDELKEQIRSKQAVNCEVSLDYDGKLSRTSFGECAVYQLIVKPLHELRYENSCYMVIAINLTPTIRARQAKERFEELFRFASDSSQVGVVYYDARTAVGMATRSWCMNMNEEFVSGSFPVYAQVVEEDRKELLEFRQAIRSGKVHESFCKEIRVNGKDGIQHWIRQHMYYVPASHRLVELSLDIDEQKSNEKRLEEAKQKAEEANEESCRFLNSISHEVRTPLNSIVGFSTILAVSDDPDTEKEFAPIILRNIRLLDVLVANILDLSALDAGDVVFHYKQFNIADVFLDMEAYMRSSLYKNPLRLVSEQPESEEERMITTDEEYLRIILLNLLSNAMKFTEMGCITLGCRREDHRFYFYVTDTGCGIDLEDQKYIFNRFVKLDTYMQGTGLGLSLCKSIVKHLGGDIGVISEKGKGSTFWFVLPNYKK